ncbi:hypothetical protein I4U23_012387 [Adineta vaga]|nr:hypothetical protein I4U23_012387 [Adineta vaga]
MSYPIQQYTSNNDTFVDKAIFNDSNDGDIFRSFLGLANRMMSDMIQNGANSNAISSFTNLDSGNSGVKVFGISSMNVTQISRGPDGRPHIVQAQDERRMGPGGIWQTKKALRDPDRGIDRMQVGYFIGEQGEIIERTRDSATGQYRMETKRRGGAPPNGQNFNSQWKIQAQQAMQRPPGLPRAVSTAIPQQNLTYNDQYY